MRCIYILLILKVLLINPWQGEIFPPPGLAYIQSTLKALPDVQVKACDLDEALQGPKDWDLVAVSFHSFSVKFAQRIRAYFPGRLICGGHHPSALPQQMLSIGFDQVVIGEGEEAIRGIVRGDTRKIIIGAESDINSIPFPDYSGFGGEWSMGIPVISSRGCPFDCSFCASSSFWGRKWRMRSSENVLHEIYRNAFNKFMFEDDNFTIDRRRVQEICEGLRGEGYFWQCASRAETLVDEDLCRLLYSSGCHTVWLGVESLSQASLDRNSKRTTVEKMLRGIATAERVGLNTMSQFIVGLPEDTEKDILETVKAIRGSKIRRRGSNVLWIVPETEAYRKAKKQGFSDEIYLSEGAPFYTYEHDINTLNHWAHLINTA